jgi:hypothetical protein
MTFLCRDSQYLILPNERRLERKYVEFSTERAGEIFPTCSSFHNIYSDSNAGGMTIEIW